MASHEAGPIACGTSVAVAGGRGMTDAQRLWPRLLRGLGHDLVVLPAIALATVLTVLGCAEIGCRAAYPERTGDACAIADPVLGLRFKANCASRSKAAEGPWVENVYNDCGSRSATACAPPRDGRPRLAIFGNSISQGYLIPYDDSYGVRLARDAAALCHRPVDVQNFARETYDWRKTSLDLDEALNVNPDLVITTVIPLDLETDPENNPHGPQAHAESSIFKKISELTTESRALAIAKSLFYKNGNNFVKLYLSYGEKANFLREPMSPFWERRLVMFDGLLQEIADKARRRGAPVLLAYVPQQAQALLAAGDGRQPGIAPYALSARIAALAARHGIYFVDATPAFAREPNPTDLYFRVDGHPSPKGQHVIAEVIRSKIASSPDLRDRFCRAPAGPSGRGGLN